MSAAPVGAAAAPGAPPEAGAESGRRSTDRTLAWLLAGLAVLVYVLSGPGRIDIIDGQVRFDVARSWVSTGLPLLRDPALQRYWLPGREGFYAPYNAGASLAGLPLVWLGDLGGDPHGERARFLFSFASALFGGLTVGLLYRFLRALGVAVRGAVGWSLVFAFASYAWPLATSTFDQAQHGFFVLAAVYLAWTGARKGSLAHAGLGGLAVGALINYQENLVLLAPALGWPLLRDARATRWQTDAGRLPGGALPARRRWLLYGVFLAGAAAGFGLWLEYNRWRFGVPMIDNRFRAGVLHPPIFTSPLPGLLSLVASPGKSVLLYSPPLLLGLLGWRSLARRDRSLAEAVLGATLVQYVFTSCLTFFGSDWSWGPRYLGPLLPLWILPAALWAGSRRGAPRARLVAAVAALGLLVQGLALSLDHQRFFFEHRLRDYFWWEKPWVYFEVSALLARPGELRRTLREGVPEAATRFAPSPYARLVTYSIFGNLERDRAPEWIRGFRVFYLPRPWPLWTRALPPGQTPPVSPHAAWPLLAGTVGLGGWLAFETRRAARPPGEGPARG